MPDKKAYMFTVGSGYEARDQSEYPLTAIWQGFTENTTAHGIPHIKHARGPIKITFWSFVSACCLGLLFYNIHLQTVQYLSHDVKVRVQMKFERKITFPAVTICNHNPILKSLLGESIINDILGNVQSANQTESGKRKRRAVVTDDMADNPQPEPDMTITDVTAEPDDIQPLQVNEERAPDEEETMMDMTENEVDKHGRPRRLDFALKLKVMKALADMDTEQKKSLGYDIDEIILDCVYRGYQCSTKSDFTSFYNNMYGNCYTYNSGWNESRELDTAYRPGPQYGLALTFNVAEQEYIGDLADSVGIRLVVHPQDRMPFPEDEGISVAPGELTYVAVSMLSVNRLSGHFSNCLQGHGNNSLSVFQEIYPVNYSTSACYKTCYQKYVIKRCSCGDCQYPFHGEAFDYANVSACDPADAIQDDCVRNVTDDYQAGRLSCDCPLACSENSYTLSTSAVPWPSNDYKVKVMASLASSNISLRLNVNSDWRLEDNVGKVMVYFKELNYELIQETAAYDGGSFLSDIGGILGLYLGFSLMTVMEFVEVSLDVIALTLLKLAMRRPSSLRPVEETTRDDPKSELKEMSAISYNAKKSSALSQAHDYYYVTTGQVSPLPGQVD